MTTTPENRFWTIANTLSLSRIVVLPVWWWVMVTPTISDWWGGAIILYGIVSDVADGYIARRMNQITSWGKILDPVGDKLSALVIGIFCILYRDMSIWAFGLTLFRDIALVIGGWFLYRGSESVPSSIDLGRYAALGWAIVLLCYAFDWQPVAGYLLWPSVVFYLIAGVVYLRSAVKSRAA
jgi:cardiolipin synthase